MSSITKKRIGMYPFQDPITNLQIRVKIQRIVSVAGGTLPSLPPILSRSVPVEDTDETETENPTAPPPTVDSETEEKIFKWQEKIFSQREWSLYGTEENCTTVLQKQYYKDVVRMRSNGIEPNNRLFSYIDGDGFVDREQRLQETETKARKSSLISEKYATQKQRKVAPQSKLAMLYRNPVVEFPSAEAIKRSHNLPRTSQTMYIMADLGPRSSDSTNTADEYVLCKLKVWNDKVLNIKPDFSKPDKPYRMESKIGVFEYFVELISPGEESTVGTTLSQPQSLSYEMNKLKISSDFDKPEEGVLKVTFLGEIVSAQGFEYDYLHVHYVVELPKGWYSASDSALEGVTQTCKTKLTENDEVAYFSFPFEITLCYNSQSFELSEGAFQWPQIVIEVLSLDNWGRYRTEGYGRTVLPTQPGQNSIKISTWRPSDGTLRSELRRFFIGGSPELENLKYVGIPEMTNGKVLSKYGFQTVSSGSVSIKLWCIQQCRDFITSDTSQQLQFAMDRVGLGFHGSIVSVLESFQKARQRMIAVRENIYTEQGLYAA